MSLKEEKKAGAPGGKRSGAAKKTGGGKPGGTAQENGTPRILHILYIVLTVISAIIVAAYIFWKIFAAPPSVDGPGSPNRPTATRPPVVITTIDPETGEQVEIEIPALSEDRKDQFYTFLLIGVSQQTGGGLTDTMMLAAYDVPNQKLSIMSLPRDIYVGYNQLLNSVYVYSGGDKDGKGAEGLKKAVQQLTGVYPDFHAVVQWEALGELVDAIGGVEFEVPFRMYYNDLSQHFKIDLQPGKQVLDGQGAMGLIRWRQNSDDRGHIDYSYGYREGDIGRIKTQQSFLKEVIKKCLQPGVLMDNLTEYISIFQENVVTNLSVGEMAYFAQSAVSGLEMDSVGFYTLPYLDAGNGHLLPDGRKIAATINASFNPYEEDIHVGELKLATEADVPRPSPSEEPEDGETTGGPEGSPEPTESAAPEEGGGEDDPILPPGVLIRPSASPKPAESAKPDASPKPSESAKPGDSPKPVESAKPGDSPKPAESAKPGASPKPSESATPGASPKPSESAAPSASPKPAESAALSASPQPTDPPEPSQAVETQPAAPTQPAPANPDDEPILPPGV